MKKDNSEKQKIFKDLLVQTIIMMLFASALKLFEYIPYIKDKSEVTRLLIVFTFILFFLMFRGLTICMKEGVEEGSLYYKIGWTLFEKSLEGLIIGMVIAIISFALNKI